MGVPIRDKKQFALIGYPLGHSISPFIHTRLQVYGGIIGSYELNEIKQGSLEKEFEGSLKKLDGFNVTIPYKAEIIPFLDSLSARAEIYGAVNTVDIKNGKATGYNTDCIGFLRAVDTAGIELKGRVLVLGCGGAARMFICECAIAEAEITVAVRAQSVDKAHKLAEEVKEKLNYNINITLIDDIYGEYDLIINATPVGMFPDTGKCPVSEAVIKKSRAAFDAVYNPLETLFLSTAKKHGLVCANGLSMLVWQAAAAEEIWNDSEFSKEEIDAVIKEAREYLKNE